MSGDATGDLTPADSGAREQLRHTLATLAYRAGKALSGAPDSFGDFKVGDTTRTPLEILAHMGDLMAWAASQVQNDERWQEISSGAWDQEVDRFFAGVAVLDGLLASSGDLGRTAARLFQGPIADALTHVGQINLLRRLAGAPVRGENYSRADVRVGHVGPEQTSPRREFD